MCVALGASFYLCLMHLFSIFFALWLARSLASCIYLCASVLRQSVAIAATALASLQRCNGARSLHLSHCVAGALPPPPLCTERAQPATSAAERSLAAAAATHFRQAARSLARTAFDGDSFASVRENRDASWGFSRVPLLRRRNNTSALASDNTRQQVCSPCPRLHGLC